MAVNYIYNTIHGVMALNYIQYMVSSQGTIYNTLCHGMELYAIHGVMAGNYIQYIVS